MKHFVAKHRFLAVALSATLLVGATTASSVAQSNFTFNGNVTINSNVTVYSIKLSGQTITNWPDIGTILLNFGTDAHDLPIANLSELYLNDRFHTFSGPYGAGAYAIENDLSEGLADFDVAYNDGDYFNDALSGDVCFRSLSGPIRIGYNPSGSLNSVLVVGTNGQVTVTSGPLYITPQGDLTMGSYTNSPPH